MRREAQDADEREWRDFRSALFASHPAEAKEILEIIDKGQEEEAGGFAEPIPEDFRKEDYVPLSADEIDESIAMLRQIGIAVE